MSRGSHVPPGRTRRSSAGQRVAGGLVLDGGGVRGHEMYKSSLRPDARDRFSGKRHAGKLARVVWEGGDGKGVICTTSPAPYFILRGAGDSDVLPPTRLAQQEIFSDQLRLAAGEVGDGPENRAMRDRPGKAGNG